MNLRHHIANALREANTKIQEANSSPDSPSYEARLTSIEEGFKQKVETLLSLKQK